MADNADRGVPPLWLIIAGTLILAVLVWAIAEWVDDDETEVVRVITPEELYGPPAAAVRSPMRPPPGPRRDSVP